MQERAQKAIGRIQKMDHQLAEETALKAIGQAVVQLHQRGATVTVQALVADLLADVQNLPPDQLLRQRNEIAARLLGWQATPPA